MEAKEIVFNTIKDSEVPLKGGEIQQATGLDKKEIDKAIKVLKTEEAIFSPKRCYYSAT
jgi:hypothetical protein